MSKRIFILILLSLFTGSIVKAAHEKGTTRLNIKDYTGNNNILMLQDNQYATIVNNIPSGVNGFFDQSIKNRLMLGVDKSITSVGSVSTSLLSGNAYSAEVYLALAYSQTITTGPNTYNLINFSIPCTLKVNYLGETTLVNVNNGSKEKDLDVYTYNGAYLSMVMINNVKIYDGANNPVSGSNFPENLYLELDYDAERYYDLNTQQVSTNPFNSNTAFFIRYYSDYTTGNQIELNWQRIPGADEYDLEWVWVDQYSGNYSYAGNASVNNIWSAYPTLDFSKNSTRIRTDQNSYRISNTFEGGYVFFRVRGVGKIKNTASQLALGNDQLTEIYTPWTWPDVSSIPSNPSSFSPASTISSIGSSVISGITVGGGVSSANVPWFINITTAGSTTLSMEPGKNWVYKSTYAEEGKKKEVVSYFDGSQRNRQTVTINNSDKIAVVAESYYDYLGRAAINALPTPVDNATIKFYQTTVNGLNGFNFENVATNPRPYTKDVFAMASSSTACTASVEPGMSDLYGTGNYYSTNNPFINSGNYFYNPTRYNNSYTPIGDYFPYSKTEFVADNTGNIARQGGVGSTFTISQTSTKHDTRYFYDVPFQEELDRLFGSEIGYANRFSKTTTIDANGQVSISYTNDEGKVVATALSANSPTNMVQLTNSAGSILANGSSSIQIDLLNKASSGAIDSPHDANQMIGDALIFNQKMTVTSAQTYSFNYSLLGSGYTGCSSFCYDCVYDLTFDIRDKCGANPVGFTPVTYSLGQIVGTYPSLTSSTNVDSLCGNDDVNFNFQQILSGGTGSLAVALTEGEWTITKKLTVNQNTMMSYLNSYLRKCGPALSTYTAAEAAAVSFTGCTMTCDQCVASLGSLSTYTTANKPKPIPSQAQIDSLTAEYYSLVNACTEPCRYVSICESAFETMLVDMSPGGQYADYEGPNNTIDPSQYPLSVLNTGNLLSKKTASTTNPKWNLPEHYLKSGSAALHFYEEDDVSISTVQITTLSAGGFQPPVVSALSTTLVSGNIYITEPHNLSNVSDFISNWKPAWAKSFVKFHPEYCYYEWCRLNSTSTGTTVSVNIYSINPTTGNPITTSSPYTATLNTSDAYDSLIVDIDELEDVEPGTSNANINKILLPLEHDPYWITAGKYYTIAPPNAPSSSSSSSSLNQRAGSSPYVLASPVNFFGASPSLYYPDFLNYKTADYRFWNYKESGLNLYQYAAIISTTLAANPNQSPATLINALNNYVSTSGLGYNTSTPPSGFTSQAEYIFMLQDLDERRGAWHKFKSMYLALKQELQQEAAQSYVMNTGCRGCNDCIGQPNFDNQSVPFTPYSQYFWWSNFTTTFPGNINSFILEWTKNWYIPGIYTLNDLQQCNMSTAGLYVNKIKRFPSAKDAAGLEPSGGNNSAANIYNTTGLCPNAYYFQNFLNELAQPGSGNSLYTNIANLSSSTPSFNDDLYKQVTGGLTVTPYGPATYNFVSAPGSVLNSFIKITPAGSSTPSYTCQVGLTFTNSVPGSYPSGITTWSNYTVTPTFTLLGFQSLAATSANNFTVAAKVKNLTTSYTVAMTGTTCINLNGCSFSPPCKVNGTGKKLRDLMNMLIANNQFTSTTAVNIGGSNPSTGSPYNTAFTNGLKPFLEINNAATTWTWQKDASANTYSISDGTTTGNNKIKITLSSPSGITMGCINSFQNFRLDPAGTGVFLVDAYVQGPPGVSTSPCTTGSFVVSGTVNIGTNLSTATADLSIGTCDFNLATCNSPEHDVKTDMEAFILDGGTGATLDGLMSNSTVNLTNNSLLTILMRSYLGTSSSFGYNSSTTPPTVSPAQDYYWWLKDATNSTTSEIKGWFIQQTSSSAPSSAPTGACKFNIKFKGNPSLPPTIETYNSLSNFTLVTNPLTNNSAYNFEVLALYGSTTYTLEGYTSCFPMRACESSTCSSVAGTITPVNTTVAIVDFSTGSGGFSLNRYQNFTENTSSGNITLGPKDFCVTQPGSPRTVACNNILPGSCFSTGSSSTKPGTSQAELTFNVEDKCSQEYPTVFQKNFTIPQNGAYELIVHGIGGVSNVFAEDVIFMIDNFTYSIKQLPITTANTFPDVNLSSGTHNLRIIFSHTTSPPSSAYSTERYIRQIDIKLKKQLNNLIPCANNTTTWPADTMPTVDYVEPCQPYLEDIIANAAQEKYDKEIEIMKNNFIRNYTKHCMSNAVEQLHMKYTNNDYHFTLYYYDQAGNLVRTVPPEGVRVLTPANTSNPNLYTDIKAERAAYPTAPTILTNHILYTTYTYNSLNQLVKQETPDAGTSEFYYDLLGRLVASQNAEQKAQSSGGSNNYFSYTKYDELGRISQVGLLKTVDLPTVYGSALPTTLSAPTFPANLSSAVRSEVTQTYYGDAPNFAPVANLAAFTGQAQQNLRTRVASVTIEETYDGNDQTFNHATHYTYDIHGNVKELVQENRDLAGVFVGQRFKNMQYEYDLISGKVNKFIYQPRMPVTKSVPSDHFEHRYEYDADNRITNVYTSRDGYSWDQDAKYYYYLHGPLARMELGQHKVQGVDYAYTLQGWIKGVNSNSLSEIADVGKDGYDPLNTGNSVTYIHNYTGRDAFGYHLNYYATDAVEDYKPVENALYSNPSDYFLAKVQSPSGITYSQLYNGNISMMGTSFLNLDASFTSLPGTGIGISKYEGYGQLKHFRYDQLNRIKTATLLSDSPKSNDWQTMGDTTLYHENFSYDQNGNIITAKRWDVNTGSSPTLDNLSYYYYDKTGGTFLHSSSVPTNATNKLARVREAASVTAAGDDIEDQ
ncbi:MAG: hypothetical protein K0S32_898, partial [Bacteroidetes bacterium]|nr:hypothetical protein [Bacteroidota bacterium]